MLKFVLGRACSGKSKYIVDDAAKKSLHKKSIIIVPEQFSFETERALLQTDSFNNDNISVLTFTKLYQEVSKIAGFGRLPVMTDGERILLTEMALRGVSDRLKIFAKFIDYPDFCANIADVIRDFKQADVSVEELYNAADKISGYSGAKIHDISVIMAAYDALIADKFIDPSDYLTRLDNLLCDIEFFKNTSVYFDSFTGFTGRQHRIIKKILNSADETVFSFCSVDVTNKDIDIFYNINETARRIISDAGDKSYETVVLDRNYYTNQTMRDLEAVFSGAELSGEPNDGSLSFFSCSDPRQEVYAATTMINHLVKTEGYRYRDFIVVARNGDDYNNYFEVFSKKNNIQCYYDKKINLCDTVLYIYINLLLKLRLSFTTENILNFIKCGFNSYKEEDIYALEDYVFVWNITGADWARDWIMNPRALEKEFDENDTELLKRINTLRRNIYDNINSFLSSFNGDAKNRVRSIYSFLEKQEINKFLASLCEKYEAANDRISASTVRQSWDAVMRVLSSVAGLYNGEITAEAFAKAFKISCSAVYISNIPQMLDEVSFGSADRIRPSKPRIAIILGANQGIFPNTSVKTGILSASDKRKLEEQEIRLNDGAIKSAVEENYLVYSMLCCPVDKTIVLFSEKSITGESREKSAFISRICEKLSNTEINKFNPLDKKYLPSTPETALYLMADLYDKDFVTVKASLEGESRYDDFIASFDKNRFTDSHNLTPENAYKLFSRDIYISASKFDTYHMCRFKYLLRFGLRAKKLEKAELGKMQKGIVIHFVLEKLINKYHKDISKLTPAEINSEVDLLIDEYISQFPGTEILMTPRFQYILTRIAAATKDVVAHICEEFKQSGFEPKYCEMSISEDGTIPPLVTPIDQGNMVLTGSVDRVDIYKNTIRIVDYKSKGKTFTLSDTLAGLNLQMLIYLFAIIKNGDSLVDNPRAGAILYMPGIRDHKTKKYTMNGLIVDDDEIVSAMEADNEGKYIPVKKSSSVSYVDEETFELVFDNIEKQIKEMGNTIRTGKLSPNPIRFNQNYNSCSYCEYSSICRSTDKPQRELAKLKNNEIKAYLKGGYNDGVQAD